MKVFAVTSGIYSDYHIVAIFSTEQKANEFVEKYKVEKRDYVDIEPYELDKHDEGEMIPTFRVHVLRDGNISYHEIELAEKQKPTYCKEEYFGDIVVYIQTEDQERAYKVAKEKWREWFLKKEEDS